MNLSSLSPNPAHSTTSRRTSLRPPPATEEIDPRLCPEWTCPTGQKDCFCDAPYYDDDSRELSRTEKFLYGPVRVAKTGLAAALGAALGAIPFLGGMANLCPDIEGSVLPRAIEVARLAGGFANVAASLILLNPGLALGSSLGLALGAASVAGLAVSALTSSLAWGAYAHETMAKHPETAGSFF